MTQSMYQNFADFADGWQQRSTGAMEGKTVSLRTSENGSWKCARKTTQEERCSRMVIRKSGLESLFFFLPRCADSVAQTALGRL